MIVVVAGSRSVTDGRVVAAAVTASGFNVTEVVSGTCHGVDRLAERWAAARGIPVARFPADWRLGRRAGVLRSTAMLRYAAAQGGALIAIWDGVSRGTRHTIDLAHQHSVPVYLHRVSG